MKSIDVVIDDYLHVIVRTRPWTKKHEEDVLEGFSDWLFEQPARQVMLSDVTPDVVQQYAAATGLSNEEHQELLDTLSTLYVWAAHQGWIVDNPFQTIAV